MTSLQQNIGRAAAFFICLVALNVLSAQGLPAAWEQYLAANDDLERASGQELRWTNELSTLRTEIQALNAQKSWYNGWIIEFGIARKVANEVELANSIETIRTEIVSLRSKQNASFSALINAYSEIVVANDTGNISLADQNQTVEFAQLLQNNDRIRWDFPDYTAMVTGPYESDQLKLLVLGDLRMVLGARLAFIDSVVSEKVTELALIERLHEFQADLSYQLESNIEVANEAEIENDVDETASTFGGLAGDRRAEEYLASNYVIEPAPAIELPLLVPSSAGLIDPPTTIGGQIERLQIIRQQYENTLNKIDSALAN